MTGYSRIHVNGSWVRPVSRATIEVRNSATEEVMAEVAEGVGEDIDLAVRAAREAPPGWSANPPVEPPEGLARGYYVRPTVFADVDNAMAIAQEEIFGPVLAILPYDDADAGRIANDSKYGLSGGVWSRDAGRAERVARLLHVGEVEINGPPFNLRAPFGGMKHSGHGRELGPYGIEEFLVPKAIHS